MDCEAFLGEARQAPKLAVNKAHCAANLLELQLQTHALHRSFSPDGQEKEQHRRRQVEGTGTRMEQSRENTLRASLHEL